MEEEKKIYIGNLEFGLTEDDVRKAIQDKGINVKEVRIITDKFSGRSKGFGFAEFETKEETQAAIEALDGQELNGRVLKVRKAKPMSARPERRGNFRGRSNFNFRR